MSPRAACRLEAFGFPEVYDYVAGKADWRAAGLDVDGDGEAVSRIADATRPDIPTCSPNDSVGDARSITFAAGWDECVVVDCDGIVVGRLRNKAWDAADDVVVEEIMEAGPSTVRSDGLLGPLIARMAERDTRLVVVSTPQGKLVGALLRDESERLIAGETPQQIWRDCDGCPGQWTRPD